MRRALVAFAACLATAVLFVPLVGSADDGKGRAELDAKLEKTGLSREKRLAIWKELVGSDDRAIWEANRLYEPEQSERIGEYHDQAVERYEAAVRKKHRVTEETCLLIEAEAYADKRKPPASPTFDVKAAAKGLDVDVYLQSSRRLYHRQNCPAVDESETRRIALYAAVSNPKLKPCGACKP